MSSDTFQFGQCASLVRASTSPALFPDSPYIALEHIDQRMLTLNGHAFGRDADSQKTGFLKGDILFGKLRPYFRKVIIAPFDGLCSTDIWVVRPLAGIDRNFLFYWMASEDFVNRATDTTEGTRMPRAKWDAVSKFEVPKRSLDEQREIGKLLRSLDDRIALLREINATLEAIAQAIFKSWFVDFDPVHAKSEGRVPEGMDEETAALFPDGFEESELGLIPRGWEIRKAETLLTRLSTKVRYSKEQVDSSGATPVYEQGVGVLLGYHDNSAQFPATPNDPLFIFGDHTCVTHLSCEPFDVSMNVIPLKGSDRSTLWTYYAIKDKQTFQEYRRHWMELTIKEIVVAPREICDQFSLIASALHVKMESNTWQANILSNLRDTLLPRLISGKLRLPEAEAIMGEIS